MREKSSQQTQKSLYRLREKSDTGGERRISDGGIDMKINNRWLAFALYVLATLAIWTLLDLITAAFILHTPYQFTVVRSLIVPLISGCALGYLNTLGMKEK
jgi:hypothetical protein